MIGSHREVEDTKEPFGILTFEKNPKYYLEITFTNQESVKNYRVNINILKPIGKLVSASEEYLFSFCQDGRAQAYAKFIQERQLIDKERNQSCA